MPTAEPQHIVISAVLLPVRSSSWSAETIRREPVAPTGWPSAIAPPFTLTFSGSISGNSWSHASTTPAKASLHSNRSMSRSDMPLFARKRRVASIGPVSTSVGSEPTTASKRMRARGRSPCAFAFSALM